MSQNGHVDPNTLQVPGRSATVTFRPFATWQDDRLIARWARERQAEDDADRAHAFRAFRTLLMVEGWTLQDRSGEVLPLTTETLEHLPRQVATWIDDEAQRRFAGRTEEEEGPFDMPSPQPSTATT